MSPQLRRRARTSVFVSVALGRGGDARVFVCVCECMQGRRAVSRHLLHRGGSGCFTVARCVCV